VMMKICYDWLLSATMHSNSAKTETLLNSDEPAEPFATKTF